MNRSVSGSVNFCAETKEEVHRPAERQLEFKSVVMPHLLSLYNIALLMTADQVNAEEMVQNTFSTAYQSFDQIQKKINFKVWFFRIMVNTYLEAYRKSIRQSKKAGFDNLEEFYLYKRIDESISPQDTAKEDFLYNLSKADVKEALKSLPFPFRLVVLLRDLEGFSYSEITDIIGAPLDIVLLRLRLGRNLLQKYIWSYAEVKNIYSIKKYYKSDK